MKQYNKEAEKRNSNDEAVSRLARRLNREFGISIDHAIVVITVNGACKEPRDG